MMDPNQQEVDQNGQPINAQFDTSIKQIEDYVNGKLPIEVLLGNNNNQTLKWIGIKWAPHKLFGRFFCSGNSGSYDGKSYRIEQRIKRGFFEFRCNKCDHTWSTHYGTFKFYIAFKKDESGQLMEDEIFVRIIAYKLDCKNCK